ncbi:YycH family regulatory protein [Lactiplantibacillus modestisalitolerans]|uniref:YycH family regulatory protein n=1 Tax=Lactiplantibacillus modestisalitolerans TaxID=1457219 RepID=A0ABV5WSL8_9LACO|nr:two-component system activity regulator YycH [Lactiplantibacillus modestisalitolerans]
MTTHKIRRMLLPLALMILVLISVALSVYIWMNPSRYERESKVSTTSSNSTLATRSVDDVYLPTQLIYTNTKGKQALLINKNVSLVSQFKDQMRKWRATSISKVRVTSAKSYTALLNGEESYVLNFPDSVTISMFNTVFKQNLQNFRSSEFSRIVIPVNDTDHLYLLNDNHHSIYSVRLKNKSLSSLSAVLRTDKVKEIPVKMTYTKNNTYLDYTGAVKMQQYSYLMSKLAASELANRLLDADGNSTVSVHNRNGKQEYTTGSFKRMTVNPKVGTVYFEDYSDSGETRQLSLRSQLQKSYTHLASLGVPMDNIRYYGFDDTSNSVIYRSYVEGFPIFNQTENGDVRIQMTTNGLDRYYFSLYSLQVPVPTTGKQQAVTLPSSESVLKQLEAAGYHSSKIGRIELGYQWSQNKSSKLVIDLTPTYYVDYNGSWRTYTSMLNGS